MGNVNKWKGIIILINEILGKVMWIKMGIRGGDQGDVSFRLYEVGNGEWNWWCVGEGHSATTPGSFGVLGSINPRYKCSKL